MCGGYIDRELLKKFNEIAAKKEVSGFHIHIYFDAGTESEKEAIHLAQNLASGKLFENIITDGPDRVGLVGPHSKPNIELDIDAGDPQLLSRFLQRIAMYNWAGLSVLIHPRTGDEVKDHLESAVWMNEPVPFNQAFFDRLIAHNNRNNKAE